MEDDRPSWPEVLAQNPEAVETLMRECDVTDMVRRSIAEALANTEDDSVASSDSR